MAYGLTFRLEHEDGTPADPPMFQSAPGVSWEPGDTISLGRDRKVRVVDTRLEEGTDGDPFRCWWSNPPSSVALELALGTVGAVDGDSFALSLLFDRSS